MITACAQQNKERHGAGDSNIEQPADSLITYSLRAQLNESTYIPVDDLDISTENGIVTLSGTIGNLLAKERAARIAESIKGVRSVVNNLIVTADRSDKQVIADVRRALAVDPATEHWEISAEIEHGLVSLSGAVDSWQERELAATVTKSVKGVTGIQNNIIVNYNATRTDEDIRIEVERRLKWDGRINDKLIEVEVNDARVTLSGSIGSVREKRLARQMVHVTGVEKVDVSALEIHPEFKSQMVRNARDENVSPQQIKKAINDAFKYDPRVPASEVAVSVSGHTASLSGTVANFNEKLAAGRDAMNTYGVEEVVNDIEVRNKVVVRPDVPTTDAAVADRIRSALDRDPYVDLVNYNVKVEKGFVTLNGTTDSRFLKTRAAEVASDVKGVIGINNKININ